MALLSKDFIVKSGLVVQGTTSPVTTATQNTGALQVNSAAAFAKDILIGSSATIYGPSVLQSTLNVAGNVNVNASKFSVDSATGNTHAEGNMGVRGTFNSTGTLSVNTDKFIVTASNGNTHAEGNMGVRGTFNSTGTLTVNTDKFTVDATNGHVHAEGNMGVRGTFNSTGTLSVNTNKFTVDAGSGNTNAAGDFSVDNTKFTVNSSTGNTSVLGTLHSGGNFDVNTDKFIVTASNGNTHAEGNMGVRGTFNSTGTLSVNTNKFTVDATNGHVHAEGNMGVRGTFNSTGTLTVNTDKFTVDSASGNTHAEGNMGVRGTFNSTGTLTVNDNFTVTASNGNVETDGTLKVNNTGSDLTTAASNSVYTLGGAHIAKDLKVGQDVVIVGKLTVQGVQTIVDSTVTNISDPVIELGTGPNSAALTVDDGLNRGIALHYYNTATSADNQMFIGRDSTGHIIVKTNAASNTNADVAAATYATMEIGSILGQDTTASTSTSDTNALDLAGGFSVRGASYIDDDLKVTGTIHGTVTQANNLNGGGTGSIPYQTAAGVTAFIPIGGSNTVLTSNGTTATWASAGSTSVGASTTATNIAGGAQYDIPFQSNTGTTTFDTGLFTYNDTDKVLKVNNITIDGDVNSIAVPAGQNIELYSSTAGGVTGISQLNHDSEIYVKAAEAGASLEVVGATFLLNTLTNAVLSGSGYLQAPYVRPDNLATIGGVVFSDTDGNLVDDGSLTFDSSTEKLTVGGSIEVSGTGGNLTMTGGDFTGALNISLTGSDGGTSAGGALSVTNGGIFSKKEVYIDSGNDYNDAHPALHIPNGGIMVGDSIGIGTHLTMTNATSTIWFKDRSNIREENGVGAGRRDLILDAEAKVKIKTDNNNKEWNFGTDGALTLPNSTKVYDDTGRFYVDALRDDSTATTLVIYNSATKELTRTTTFNSTLTINSVVINGTAASSTNTTASGALQVLGGVGIAGGLYVDQDAYVNADLYVQGTLYVQGNSLDGVDQITGSTGTFVTVNTENINITGTNPTLANTSTIVPSFKTAGGATVEKDLYVGSTATFNTSIYVANDIYLGGKVLSSTSSNFANVTASGDANLNNVSITGTFTATSITVTTTATITSTADTDLQVYGADLDKTSQSLGVRGGIKALGNVSVGKVLYAGMNDGGHISGQNPHNKPIDGVFIVNSMQSGGTYDGLAGNTWTQTIDSWDKTRYTSAKYLIQIKDGTSIHTQEMIIIHDGTNVYVTEYGIVNNNGDLGTFGGGYNGANVELTFSPNYSTTAMIIQVVRQSIINSVEEFC